MAKLLKIEDKKVIIETVLNKKLTETVKRRITQALEKEAYKMNREELLKGLDTNGKRIKKFTLDYDLQKRQYIRGKLKHRKKSIGKKWYNELYRKSPFRAKGMPSYGFKRGITYAGLTFLFKVKSVTDKAITFSSTLLSEEPNAKKIIEGLKNMGRNYYGLADPNTNAGRRQKERMKKIILRYI